MYLRGFKNWADIGLIKSFKIILLDEEQLNLFDEESANNNKNIKNRYVMEVTSVKGKKKLVNTARGKVKVYASIDTAFADAQKIDSSVKTLLIETA